MCATPMPAGEWGSGQDLKGENLIGKSKGDCHLQIRDTAILMRLCRDGDDEMHSLLSLLSPLVCCQGSSLSKPNRCQRTRSPLMVFMEASLLGHGAR